MVPPLIHGLQPSMPRTPPPSLLPTQRQRWPVASGVQQQPAPCCMSARYAAAHHFFLVVRVLGGGIDLHREHCAWHLARVAPLGQQRVLAIVAPLPAFMLVHLCSHFAEEEGLAPVPPFRCHSRIHATKPACGRGLSRPPAGLQTTPAICALLATQHASVPPGYNT